MFPTSLCGVLVFDSVSRAPHTHNTITTHTQTHTHNTHTTHTQTTSHTHTDNFTHTQHNNFTHAHTDTHTHQQHAAFCVAGVALGDIHFRFAWQAWHNLTSTVVLRGRHGTHRTGWRPWARFRRALVARDAAALCVAGVAQSHIHGRFAWQAPHGTGWRPWARFRRALVARDAAALCVAGVAQSHIHGRFAWQAWHNHTSVVVLRGRRLTHGTGWRAWARFRRALVARDAAALCEAGVAQSHIHGRFAWQAWQNRTSMVVLRGRRLTWHWVAPLGPV